MNDLQKSKPLERPERANLYRSAIAETDGSVHASQIAKLLKASGLMDDDPRISKTLAKLNAMPDSKVGSPREFGGLVSGDEAILVERALTGALAVPDFADFSSRIESIFEQCLHCREGDVATYIPQLARVSPEKFGLGLCTVDGQRMSLGDDEDRFCVQSTCKPINYALAHDLCGRTKLHRHIGREPSGRTFNELTLNNSGLPHNPMINAGAIMAASLILPGGSQAERFDLVTRTWRNLAGGCAPGFDNAVFLSEKETADRNFALAYFMREKHAFPPHTNILDTLEFYFQCCSVTLDVRAMSVVAATLANGGVCPTTNERILSAEAVKDCLSLMYSCGMYDFSGEFAFTVGIPAKSGVSGALMLVIPGICGIALWSPRLDRCGNSVRGVHFATALSDTFSFHNYATMVEGPGLLDPTVSRTRRRIDEAGHLCAAAAGGDLPEIRRLIASGLNLSQADYDGRTALHLAASEGHAAVVRLLLAAGAEPRPRDRWGNTPLDDAKREGRETIVAILDEQTVRSGKKSVTNHAKAA